MLSALKLLLPALIPSWRFFQGVAPSPRIEFTLLEAGQDLSNNWREFRPRPARLSVMEMLKRIFWNPGWNELLFLVSCAERLIQNPTEHSAREISNRIRNAIAPDYEGYFQFRLVFINRQGETLEKHVIYMSDVYQGKADLVS